MVEKYEKNGSGLCCNLSTRNSVEKLEDYLPPTTFDDLGFWEIEPGSLLYDKKTDTLGSGAFGKVYRAKFQENPDLKVAVKILKNQKDDKQNAQNEFKKETDIMKTLEHQYILRLYGIYIDNDEHGIVTELMDGSLESRLKSARNSVDSLRNQTDSGSNLTLGQMIKWLVCISSGMKYLSDKKMVHRDLRSANVLIKDEIAKIADFGLSRIVASKNYEQKKESKYDSKFPVRFTAPETVLNPVYQSTEGDVWSFGILIYEILSHGKRPFSEVPIDEIRVYMRRRTLSLNHENAIPKGILETVKIKKHCDQLWKWSDRCCSWEPSDRPKFSELEQSIDDQYEAFLNDFEGNFEHIVPNDKAGEYNPSYYDEPVYEDKFEAYVEE